MRVLVFAPADDEVLGCGGVITKYSERGAEVHVCVVTNTLRHSRTVDLSIYIQSITKEI